jgi:hypothetical protein
MKNPVQLDQNHNNAIRTEIAERLGYLLSREVSSPPLAPVEHSIPKQEADLLRLQMMQRETTDPLAARLLQDIIFEMEADLKEQVDRLVAGRH